jgi:hypothetical protein
MPVVLQSVRDKFARAKHHFEFFQTEATRYAQQSTGHGVLDADRNVNSAVMDFQMRHPIPPDIPLIVGDCLQNLRSALDYLVWEAVSATGGQPSKRNAFPICTSAKAFGVEIDKKRLDGIQDPKIIAKIETLQPYNNGNGLKQDPLFVMDELTNISKHRRILLTILKGSFILGRSEHKIGNTFCVNLGITVIHDDTKIPAPVAGQMQMNPQIMASIAFNEGCAQDENVLELLGATAKFVESIVSDFERLIP